MPTISQIQIGDTTYDIKDAAARSSIEDYFKIITFVAPEFVLRYNGYNGMTLDNDKIGVVINLWPAISDEAEEWSFIAMLGLSYSATTDAGTANNQFMIRSWGAWQGEILETFWRNWSGQLLHVQSNYRTLWYNPISGLWKERESAENTGLFRVDGNGKVMGNILYLDEQQ